MHVHAARAQTDRCGSCWIADELDDGRIGVVGKAHHCMVDGIAAVELAAAAARSRARLASRAHSTSGMPAEPPGPARRLVDGVVDRTRDQLALAGSAARLVASPGALASGAQRAGRALLSSLAPASPLDALNGPIFPYRAPRRSGGRSTSSARSSGVRLHRQRQPAESEGAGPWMIRNQNPNTTSAITAEAPKIRASAPVALLVAGGTAHDPPHAVQPRAQRERHEQREQDPREGDDDAAHVRAEPVVGLRADPQPRQRLRAPHRQAQERLDDQDQPRASTPSARRRPAPPGSGVPR